MSIQKLRSALLNSTYQEEMKNVVEVLREKVKVIIGGTICTENVRKFTGADAYANDAMTGVKFANKKNQNPVMNSSPGFACLRT
ncbi:MAG: hypothetical protein PWP45_1558 [Tepidanaerobacteraceae bacterium]|nr:hypothetical protein [Tepidanaerobacteraceae bacterium]